MEKYKQERKKKINNQSANSFENLLSNIFQINTLRLFQKNTVWNKTPHIDRVLFSFLLKPWENMINDLKNLDFAKNERKEQYYKFMGEIICIEICKRKEIEKKRCNIQKKLNVCWFALEKTTTRVLRKNCF